MRRVTMLVTAIGVAMLLASGVALAVTFDGTDTVDFDAGVNEVADNCEIRDPH